MNFGNEIKYQKYKVALSASNGQNSPAKLELDLQVICRNVNFAQLCYLRKSIPESKPLDVSWLSPNVSIERVSVNLHKFDLFFLFLLLNGCMPDVKADCFVSIEQKH